MTDTTNRTSTLPTGTVEHIAPNLVQFEDNVRETVDLDKGFVVSIKGEGVLLPVLARRAEDGTIYVRDGQRRTLAAREAGLATIPAYFGTISESKTARITQQLVANDRRASISVVERVNAFQQLALEGMSSATIARKTGEKKATVEASIAVAQSPSASEAIATGQISLDAALIIAEFEDDPNLAANLAAVALENPDRLPHAAQRAREDRDRTAKIATAAAELTAAGVRVITEDDDTTGVALSRLTDDETTRIELDAEAHASCPGHAVTLAYRWTGDIVASPVCLDPEGNGHKPRWAEQPHSAPQSGPMTDEQKAERRTVIENNRAWDAAEAVRIEWLTAFFSRKTLPKDAAQFIARGLTTHRSVVGTSITNGNLIAAKLLGADNSEGRWGTDRFAAYVTNNPTKAQHATLAVILGGIEASTSRSTWRNVDRHAADYLTRLAGWGYTLSDVEQIVVDAATTADTEEAARTAGTPPVADADPFTDQADDVESVYGGKDEDHSGADYIEPDDQPSTE